jgi:hypothetical protein
MQRRVGSVLTRIAPSGMHTRPRFRRARDRSWKRSSRGYVRLSKPAVFSGRRVAKETRLALKPRRVSGSRSPSTSAKELVIGERGSSSPRASSFTRGRLSRICGKKILTLTCRRSGSRLFPRMGGTCSQSGEFRTLGSQWSSPLSTDGTEPLREFIRSSCPPHRRPNEGDLRQAFRRRR